MKNKMIRFLNLMGFSWFVPLVRLAAGEDAKEQLGSLWSTFGISFLTFAAFLALWSGTASQIQTSLGRVPGPLQVLAQAKSLSQDYFSERKKEAAFYERQMERNAKEAAAGDSADVKMHKYTGTPTYVDQIFTSLRTVFAGFLLASLIAIPIGILCGLNRTLMTSLTPLIQIFKPVSPVAWLPIVTMIVSAVYTSHHPLFEKSFIISAITVALCSLWPSLINTSIGVASIDKDYINVGRVLKLGFFTRVFKIVLPSSMPYIFAGLRISLGIGWMVLIACEMLSQNPGLGKFVWDEFQNGSSQSLSRIMVSVFTIGLIGFVLDRIMVMLHRLVSFGQETAS